MARPEIGSLDVAQCGRLVHRSAVVPPPSWGPSMVTRHPSWWAFEVLRGRLSYPWLAWPGGLLLAASPTDSDRPRAGYTRGNPPAPRTHRPRRRTDPADVPVQVRADAHSRHVRGPSVTGGDGMTTLDSKFDSYNPDPYKASAATPASLMCARCAVSRSRVGARRQRQPADDGFERTPTRLAPGWGGRRVRRKRVAVAGGRAPDAAGTLSAQRATPLPRSIWPEQCRVRTPGVRELTGICVPWRYNVRRNRWLCRWATAARVGTAEGAPTGGPPRKWPD